MTGCCEGDIILFKIRGGSFGIAPDEAKLGGGGLKSVLLGGDGASGLRFRSGCRAL